MNSNCYPDLVKLYVKCKFKVYGWDGRPRPCCNQRCPSQECERAYSFGQATILLRSFLEKPPNFCFVLRLEDDGPKTRRELNARLDVLVQKFAYLRKKSGIVFEFEARQHFVRGGAGHWHLTVRTSAGWTVEVAKDVMRSLWDKSCPGREVSVYCDVIHNLTGYVNYITHNKKDHRWIERPPQAEPGTRPKLVRRSNGFLVRPEKVLRKEQGEEWYRNRAEFPLDSVGEIGFPDAGVASSQPPFSLLQTSSDSPGATMSREGLEPAPSVPTAPSRSQRNLMESEARVLRWAKWIRHHPDRANRPRPALPAGPASREPVADFPETI